MSNVSNIDIDLLPEMNFSEYATNLNLGLISHRICCTQDWSLIIMNEFLTTETVVYGIVSLFKLRREIG